MNRFSGKDGSSWRSLKDGKERFDGDEEDADLSVCSLLLLPAIVYTMSGLRLSSHWAFLLHSSSILRLVDPVLG